MIRTLEQHLQEAIYLDNRGFKEDARKHYDQLKVNLHRLNTDGLQRVSQFYDKYQEAETVFHAAKLGIEMGGDAKVLVPLYIESWENLDREFEDLEWILKKLNFDHLTREYLLVARHLFVQGKVEKAYIIALEIGEKVERSFRRNPSEYALYVDSVLHLVELEHLFGNQTQARFHVRKLIFLESERLVRVQDITYWASLLDELPGLVKREDWNKLSEEVTGDVALVAHFYNELTQRVLTKATVEQLETARFIDKALEKKRKSYLTLLAKMSGRKDWFKGIYTDRDQVPDDLLTTLLYADYLKAEQPEELTGFWKREFPKHADKAEAINAYWNMSKRTLDERVETNLDDCSITFFGGGQKIGGTSILISVKGHHVLLDAGMHLNEDVYHPDYSLLDEKGLTLDELDALLITHAHMDHTGAIPYVHKQRSDLPIYATNPTVELMKLLLTDAVRINGGADPEMYTEVDVQNTLLSIRPVEFHQSFQVPSGDASWKVTYYPSGHILGAGSIHLEIEGVSILFTGDYSIDEQKTVQGLRLPSDIKVDILITESTYGFLPTNASIERSRQEELFIESVKRTMDKSGSMLIPAFAVGRAQEIILILKDAFKKEKYLPFNLFLDGRVTNVCRIYERYSEQNRYINPSAFSKEDEESLFFGGGVQSAQDIYSNRRDSHFTFDDFMDDYIMPGNNCIVASSGMLTENSASARYAERLIGEAQNTISFTGYMDEESPGHHILQKANSEELENIRMNGQEKEIRAKIESFRLSAHASREQILQLILDVRPKRVFLMHGEHEKRFASTQTIVTGEKIYPSLIELLTPLQDEIEVTPAFNGNEYFLN
ncbi:MBL fold metallo-hydrolase [Exiguobacterium chiriqhucha]|uniref:Beta-lactamase n=1 Tax=Exiguobacterium chiriqhucha RW-2 TaxID=1345023 RepID=U1M065_9BACL|nr:MBL fold metallo-hydrolase [Exiguobacterium chiriqhucha]ERG68052.1 hypothetical protein M467_12250 [Exiguobacterium chiriqhucha RW-2]